jgi:hypothetical protein
MERGPERWERSSAPWILIDVFQFSMEQEEERAPCDETKTEPDASAHWESAESRRRKDVEHLKLIESL